jgi:CRP-like cAMP-binding protein
MPTTTSRFRISKSLGDGALQKAVQNSILLALPRVELATLFDKLERVDLPVRTVLHQPGRPIEFGYFMEGGLASLLAVMSDGKSVEVGLSGKEGFIGTPLTVGFRTSPSLAVMQVNGSAFRIRSDKLVSLLGKCPRLAELLNQFSQQLMMQSSQVAACNRIHEVEERLARWLLMSQDRLQSNSVPLTQQTLANMLGTRRASVTVAAGILQKRGLITYVRGKVAIENRRGLEASSCECYKKMGEQFRRWQHESK